MIPGVEPGLRMIRSFKGKLAESILRNRQAPKGNTLAVA
jgi:hypothetical protein